MEKTFDAREVDFAGTHAPTKTGEVEPFFSIAPFAGKDFWQRMIYLLQHSLKGTSPYHSSSYKSLATALTLISMSGCHAVNAFVVAPHVVELAWAMSCGVQGTSKGTKLLTHQVVEPHELQQ